MRGVILRGLVLCLIAFLASGCATVRVTDPPRTATEQYLMLQAVQSAVAKLSAAPIRDRMVYVDSTYLTALWQPSLDHSFMLGELRAKLLMSGVRMARFREEAEIILEVRSQSIGIDRYDYLIGIPGISLGTATAAAGAPIPVVTPELAIIKSTKQQGFADIAFVAYWRDTGEVVATSGPFDGRTQREDFWILGFGPRTVGNIPPARPVAPTQ
jgi:hypothetical protein